MNDTMERIKLFNSLIDRILGGEDADKVLQSIQPVQQKEVIA